MLFFLFMLLMLEMIMGLSVGILETIGEIVNVNVFDDNYKEGLITELKEIKTICIKTIMIFIFVIPAIIGYLIGFAIVHLIIKIYSIIKYIFNYPIKHIEK